MNVSEICLAVEAAGCQLVAKEGRLFVTPPGRLPPALRPHLEANKAGLVAWLQTSADRDARQAALDAVLPQDFDSAVAGEDACTLLKLHDATTGQTEYLAVDGMLWDELTAWAKSRREDTARKEAQANRKRKE